MADAPLATDSACVIDLKGHDDEPFPVVSLPAAPSAKSVSVGAGHTQVWLEVSQWVVPLSAAQSVSSQQPVPPDVGEKHVPNDGDAAQQAWPPVHPAAGVVLVFG